MMTPRVHRLIHRYFLSASGFALLLGSASFAGGAGPARPVETAVIDSHNAAVIEVVRQQVIEQVSPVDTRRATVLEEWLRHRPDVTGARKVEAIDRKAAISAGLANNLRIKLSRSSVERTEALVNEVKAVFDPVLDVTVGYARADTERRSKLGRVYIKPLNAKGFNSGNPLNNVPPQDDTEQAKVTQLKLRQIDNPNGSKAPFIVEREIDASAGRSFGSPDESLSFSLQVRQELPWGGTLSIADRTADRDVHYRAGYYWKDAQWSTNLSGSLNMPIPGTKGFGSDNPANSAIRNAQTVRQQADWELKVLLNTVLLEIDVAYFETARRLEAFEATSGNRDLVLKQQQRVTRLFDMQQATRFQKAQMDAELSKAEIRVEQAFSDYVSASQSLAVLIGDPATIGSSAIYLPVAYADDLAQGSIPKADDALKIAQVNRPEFKVEDLNRTLREISLGLAHNQANPDVRFAASVVSSQNGSTYGYRTPLISHSNFLNPDRSEQNYGVTFTRPLGNVAADARVSTAELGLQDQELVAGSLLKKVRREITERLAAMQSARSRVKSSGQEVESLRATVVSLVRQMEIAGTVSEDELILVSRKLLVAELALTGARIDLKQAETALLFAQGTISRALADQTSASSLDRNRIVLLSDAGYLSFFSPATAH